MKNVRESQLKKCIFLTEEELKEILESIYETTVIVHIAADGLWYESPIDIDDECLLQDLKEYFEVKEVQSIHCDDTTPAGIWICYKD